MKLATVRDVGWWRICAQVWEMRISCRPQIHPLITASDHTGPILLSDTMDPDQLTLLSAISSKKPKQMHIYKKSHQAGRSIDFNRLLSFFSYISNFNIKSILNLLEPHTTMWCEDQSMSHKMYLIWNRWYSTNHWYIRPVHWSTMN